MGAHLVVGELFFNLSLGARIDDYADTALSDSLFVMDEAKAYHQVKGSFESCAAQSAASGLFEILARYRLTTQPAADSSRCAIRLRDISCPSAAQPRDLSNTCQTMRYYLSLSWVNAA